MLTADKSKAEFHVAEATGAGVTPPSDNIVADSQGLGWHALYADIIDSGPLDAHAPVSANPSIVYHLSHATKITRRVNGGARETALIQPRNLCINPAGHSVHWQHEGHPSLLRIFLRSSVFERAAGALYPGRPAELLPQFEVEDPLLEQLALAIANELRTGHQADHLYADSVGEMIAAQLARFHTSRRPHHSPRASAHTRWPMRRLADYIEEHLGGDLRLEALALEVGLSPNHLLRTFTATHGKPPHQYVLERRIERAKKLLQGSERTIADIAFAAGFSSQSHLTNLFRRFVGVSPALYRRRSKP